PSREFPSPRSCRKRNCSCLSSRRLVTGAGYFKKGPVFEAQRAQPPAPHAAAVERGELRRELQAERRPVPEYDRLLVLSQLEPGHIPARRALSLGLEVHPAFRRGEPHARHG